MSVFKDQTEFMQACGQTTDRYNEKQTMLYARLVDEEVNKELLPAVVALPLAGRMPSLEQLDAVVDGALDTIVVAIGLLRSLGLDPQPLWNEVVRSNNAKIDPLTGRVHKRADGKVLKPDDWEPPALESLIAAQIGRTL